MASLFLAALSVCASGENPRVLMVTNRGEITLELYAAAAPVTVDNFLSYIRGDFYNGLLFHRAENVNPENPFGLDVIQGGACYYYNSNFYFPDTNDAIINESFNGLSNVRGTIAMARAAEPHSATAQFFLNHKDNTQLDRANYPDGYGYCVFGRVVSGMDVVDTIAAAPVVNLQTINPFYPPYEYFPNPIIGMYEVNVLASESSYGSDFNADHLIQFADFALFASHWLEEPCASANGFCEGCDLDYSGQVDVADLELFLHHWNRPAGYESPFSDIASDGTIDVEDLAVLAGHWLESGCDESNGFCGGADINHDQKVTIWDFALFSGNWLAAP